MKILFVVLSPFKSNTSAMLRNKALIKGFLENGNFVDVIAINSANSKNQDDINQMEHKNLNIQEVKISKTYENLISERKSFLSSIKKNIILPVSRYIYHKLSLYDNSIFLVNKIDKKFYENKKYNVVISSSDPKSSHIAASNMIQNGLQYDRWIQYWGDPLALDITNKSIYPKFYRKIKEYNILKNADEIVYVSPLTFNAHKKEFKILQNKMRWIPIPYLKEKIYENKTFNFENVNIGYFGDYNSKVRNIIPLYEVCKDMKIDLKVAGNSNLDLECIKNIRVYPRLQSSEIEKLESKIDILVCILNLKGTQLPGKLYHYAATNKPILVILDGEYKKEILNYLKKFERFVFCDNKASSIKSIIERICLDKKIYSPCKDFNYKVVSKNFIKKVNDKNKR